MTAATAAPLAPIDDTLTTIRPSMSKSDLLIQCAWPWGKRVLREEVGAPARFGSAFHEAVATHLMALLRSSGVEIDYADIARRWSGRELKTANDVKAAEVKARVDAALPALLRFFKGENAWRLRFLHGDVVEIETSVAWEVERSFVRRVPSPDIETHVYNVSSTELPGTADFVSLVKPRGLRSTLLVLDHKTGHDVPSPGDSAQLKSLAWTYRRLLKAPKARVILAILHAPSDSNAVVYAEEIDDAALTTHHARIAEAFARIGDGSLRQGDSCTYCPAFAICPTVKPALASLAKGKSNAITTEDEAGRIHLALQTFRKLDDDVLSPMLRAWVKAYGPFPREDGMVVDLVERSSESLSKASIIEALGKLDGEKEIERLRKKGCLKQSTREELRAMRDSGK